MHVLHYYYVEKQQCTTWCACKLSNDSSSAQAVFQIRSSSVLASWTHVCCLSDSNFLRHTSEIRICIILELTQSTQWHQAFAGLGQVWLLLSEGDWCSTCMCLWRYPDAHKMATCQGDCRPSWWRWSSMSCSYQNMRKTYKCSVTEVAQILTHDS